METLKRQYIIFETIEKMRSNFKKDSPGRKTADYVEKRLSTLEALWEEFNSKDQELKQSDDKTIINDDYSNLVDKTTTLYGAFKTLLQKVTPTTSEEKGMPSKADELFSLPCVNKRDCTRDMYKLSRVHVHLTSNFALFEFKLPLVNTERYELNRVIPIPQTPSGATRKIVITAEYLAVNLKKDAIIPLFHQDITSCLQVKEHHLICPTNLPIYDTKASANICEVQIINNKNISACKTMTAECADKWVRLHNTPGAWLFACCQECAMRTFCPDGVSPITLHGTGIVTLGSGCMIKGDNVVIQSHTNFHSEMTISEDNIYTPESSLNYVIVEKNYTFMITTEDHREALDKLKTSIDTVKMQQETWQEISSSHETHHYTSSAFIIICSIAAGVWASVYIKRRLRNTAARSDTQDQEPEIRITEATFRHLPQPQDKDSVSDVIVHAPTRIDKATP